MDPTAEMTSLELKQSDFEEKEAKPKQIGFLETLANESLLNRLPEKPTARGGADTPQIRNEKGNLTHLVIRISITDTGPGIRTFIVCFWVSRCLTVHVDRTVRIERLESVYP
jgi:hypothetical protein